MIHDCRFCFSLLLRSSRNSKYCSRSCSLIASSLCADDWITDHILISHLPVAFLFPLPSLILFSFLFGKGRRTDRSSFWLSDRNTRKIVENTKFSDKITKTIKWMVFFVSNFLSYDKFFVVRQKRQSTTKLEETPCRTTNFRVLSVLSYDKILSYDKTLTLKARMEITCNRVMSDTSRYLVRLLFYSYTLCLYPFWWLHTTYPLCFTRFDGCSERCPAHHHGECQGCWWSLRSCHWLAKLMLEAP